jgi:hypothetical protein
MWYRHAKKHTHPLEQIAHKVAQSAVEIWQDTHKVTTTPNLPIAFSKELTQCLLDCLADVADLKTPDPEGIYSSLKNQVESYASLLYRELGLRYYILLSEKRSSGELDEAELQSKILDEVEEATLDLMRQTLKPDDLPENPAVHEMKADSEPHPIKPKHGFSFPLAEEIDLAADDPPPSQGFRLIKI